MLPLADLDSATALGQNCIRARERGLEVRSECVEVKSWSVAILSHNHQ